MGAVAHPKGGGGGAPPHLKKAGKPKAASAQPSQSRSPTPAVHQTGQTAPGPRGKGPGTQKEEERQEGGEKGGIGEVACDDVLFFFSN